MAAQLEIEKSWKEKLTQEFDDLYMKELRDFLANELKAGKKIFPHGKEIFAAFNHTPFDKTKVVIIGQDPYHGPGQAHGLCFSVRPGVKTPPSLVNIYKEMANDLDIQRADHGNLTHWAEQGVLLLNQVLTVEEGKAASHHGRGWEVFTDKVVEILNDQKEGLVFFLWGAPAQKKGKMINTDKHLVLKSPHPSPLSAHRGFFGSRHFSKCNDYLEKRGEEPIAWELPPLH